MAASSQPVPGSKAPRKIAILLHPSFYPRQNQSQEAFKLKTSKCCLQSLYSTLYRVGLPVVAARCLKPLLTLTEANGPQENRGR
ncbi:hypothetical protein CLOM_g212 [Closterium sp. NIES-68]|nr:hypothetical protein CLOM_g212 [Closterium sp. NIES-68]GJP68029.1 hypothetical protein CLOP_g24786 [Closterium sp. NIES-67]